jgi:hypothetical protein
VSPDPTRIESVYAKPEQRLLLSCAKTELSSADRDRVCDLLKQPMDWASLMMLATSQGVMPILYHSLMAVGRQKVPQAFVEKLQLYYLANVSRNIAFVRELFQVMDLLDGAGILSVPLKGPMLAVTAYGSVSLRQFCDLDILVHRSEVRRAKECLSSAGYVNNFGLTLAAEDALIRYQKDFQFVSPGRGTIIELHWALEPAKRFRSFNDERVWQRLTHATLEGRVFPNLCPEDSLLYLCLHGANHRWDRLCWICDVAQTIERYPEMDWQAVVGEAHKLQCQRILFLGLSLAATLLDAPVPAAVADRAASYPQVDKLTALVTEQLFAAPEHVSELSRSLSFHVMVRESLMHKVQLWARRILVPDALDFRGSRLPPALFFLVPLFRPLRLLGKHVPTLLAPQSWRR